MPLGAARGPAALCAFAILCAALLAHAESEAYRFLVGARDPVLLTAAVCAVALLGLRVLVRRGWAVAGAPGPRVVGRIAALGAVLALPVVFMDLLGAFPAEMNVPPPDALLFYPSIAVAAESVFHVLPLAIVALVTAAVAGALRPVSGGRAEAVDGERAVSDPAWVVAVGVASLPEPAFQVPWGLAHSPLWATTMVGAHLLVFNVVGVHVLRRHGFVAVWVYRMGYYLVWHLTWGVLRLGILFGSA